MFLQDHAPNLYKELKREYGSTSQGWFLPSITSKLGHLGSTIGRAFTKEAPLELPLMETVSDVLRGIPEEKRISLFIIQVLNLGCDCSFMDHKLTCIA